MTIPDIVCQLADLRFTVAIDKARQEPYRLVDRTTHKTIAKFITPEDLERFRKSYCDDFIAKVLHELQQFNSGSSVPVPPDGPHVQSLSGQAHAGAGQVPVHAL